MKYINPAVIALLATVKAYDESEGPTKEDNGEIDPSVIYRESDIANGKKFSGWTNPLGWSDSGADDDRILVQLKKHQKNYSELEEYEV